MFRVGHRRRQGQRETEPGVRRQPVQPLPGPGAARRRHGDGARRDQRGKE